jgi:hypothetical protein
LPPAEADNPVPPARRETLKATRRSAERIALQILGCPQERRRAAISKTYGVFLALALARGCSGVVAGDFVRPTRQTVRDVVTAARLTSGRVSSAQ